MSRYSMKHHVKEGEPEVHCKSLRVYQRNLFIAIEMCNVCLFVFSFFEGRRGS